MTTKTETLRKIQRAAEIFDGMSELQKDIVKPYVDGVITMQREISMAAEAVKSGVICSECQGACCTDGVEGDIEVEEYLYAMFVISKKQRAKIYTVINSVKSNGDCALVGEEGCVLPDETRPIMCKGFHCFMIPESKEIMGNISICLKEAYGYYLCALDIAEVEL